MVDPVYFCVIGLVRGAISMEAICHEAVHAAYAYTNRVRTLSWPGSQDSPEENLCYPAGRIAAEINRKLWKHDLYKKL